MTSYSLPPRISALIFDMDGTLYTNPHYAQMQIDLCVEQFAKTRGKTFEAAQAEIAAYRAEYAKSHDGQKTSLANALLAFGVGIAESVRWREELYEPALHLTRDAKLLSALQHLQSAPFRLALVTNNPVLTAQKTVSVLGVTELFEALVGLDTCLISKPAEAPFLKAAELLGVTPGECVSIGDRFDVDIAVPLRLGMGGVLVQGVEDVYEIPTFLQLFRQKCV